MTSEIQIKNELDVKDFAEAERITPARGHWFYRYMYFMSRFALVGLLLLFPLFVLLAFQTAGGIHSWNDAGRLLVMLAIVGAFFWGKFNRVWKDRYGNAVKRMDAYTFRMSDTIVVNQSGLQMLSGISDTLNRSIGWDEFVGYHEGERIFLVIEKGSHEELLIPKRDMTESAQNELRDVLEKNVGNW